MLSIRILLILAMGLLIGLSGCTGYVGYAEYAPPGFVTL